jgi:hypothetical protein
MGPSGRAASTYPVFFSDTSQIGLTAPAQQDPKQTLYFAHLFFADHIVSTLWTVIFATTWWLYTPHDGQRTAKSDAQKEIMKTADPSVYHGYVSDAERANAALAIWDQEKRSAAFIIIFLWLSKVCIISCQSNYRWPYRVIQSVLFRSFNLFLCIAPSKRFLSFFTPHEGCNRSSNSNVCQLLVYVSDSGA